MAPQADSERAGTLEAGATHHTAITDRGAATPAPETAPRQGAAPAADRIELQFGPLQWALTIVALCLVVFIASNPVRENFYVHFVWQSQAWLDGQTSIPLDVEATDVSPGNAWYQDVMPIRDAHGPETGRGIIPFPPLPSLVLLPFVAIWHLRTNEQLLAAVFGALDVGLAYWVLGYLPVRRAIRNLTAVFFGLGTTLWYASVIGTTWFWAHIVAMGCLLIAIGLALSADRAAAEPETEPPTLRGLLPSDWRGMLAPVLAAVAAGVAGLGMLTLGGANAAVGTVFAASAVVCVLAVLLAALVAGPRPTAALSIVLLICAAITAALVVGERQPAALYGTALAALVVVALAVVAPGPMDRAIGGLLAALRTPEARQIAAGFLLGLAVDARLTILFGFPFLMLVGGGGTWLRRSLLAGAGLAIPIVGLLAYTYASTGDLFNPAYDYLYHRELAYTFLNYHANWSITDIRYVPQNLKIFLFNLPQVAPAADQWGSGFCTAGEARGVFDPNCPLVTPDPVGTSVLLTSPAYLLAPFAFFAGRLRRVDRLTLGAAIAVVAIAFVNLMHFSQGWVQFGYRFANDFAPFAILLVALGAARLGPRRLGVVALLVAASVAVNMWGTIWGVVNGW